MTSAPEITPEAPGELAEDEVEPVELLVQLAEDGEIDPWDIDVVEVTDAFLARLDETDLRTSGRALFYASVLLRMKSDALVEGEEEADEPDEVPPWEAPQRATEAAIQAESLEDPIDALEDEMERRLDRKSARGTPETLDELVRELREAERGTWWKPSRTYDTSESPTGFRRGVQTVDYHHDDAARAEAEPTEAEVTGDTHSEDIEGIIAEVRTAITQIHERGRDEVLFAEVDEAGGSRVETYLGLLFLSHRGEVRLRQDTFFGDLWVSAV
jgi:segregation and condensation protein A